MSLRAHIRAADARKRIGIPYRQRKQAVAATRRASLWNIYQREDPNISARRSKNCVCSQTQKKNSWSAKSNSELLGVARNPVHVGRFQSNIDQKLWSNKLGLLVNTIHVKPRAEHWTWQIFTFPTRWRSNSKSSLVLWRYKSRPGRNYYAVFLKTCFVSLLSNRPFHSFHI